MFVLKRLVVSFEYEIKAKPNEIIGKSTIDYSLFVEEMLKSANRLLYGKHQWRLVKPWQYHGWINFCIDGTGGFATKKRRTKSH